MILNKDKKYEAQALAIAMVVMVVSSLIGISIYSRSMKDKGLVLEERASAEALEVADLILDKLTPYPMSFVVDAIVEIKELDEFNYENGIVLKENRENTDLTRLLTKLEVLQIGNLSDLLGPLCPVSQGLNEYQLTLKESDNDTYYEVKAGSAWSLPTRNLQESCALDLNLEIRGDSRSGFVLTKVYCNYDIDGNVTDCKKYEDDDILNYCFSSNGSDCNNQNFLDEEWTKYRVNDKEVISLSIGEYPLSEVRIKAIFGTIGITYSLPSECVNGFRMYQLRATANCSGVYRGKEIIIPEAKWYNPLFDYVLFNSGGSL